MKKYISQQEALSLLQKYCAYQERCHREVRTKLLSLGIYGEYLEEIIGSLIEEDFLNEIRFAKTCRLFACNYHGACPYIGSFNL